MKILHIESATEVCSVAISDGTNVLAFCEAEKPMSHAAMTTVLVERCLAEAKLEPTDLEAISLSKGPGSYTSLRVGSSVAKGMCYALNLPLIAVDTLESLAMAAVAQFGDTDALYCPMIDARRMEVYTTLYDARGAIIRPLESLIVEADSFAEFVERGQKIIFIGSGAEKCSEILNFPNFSFHALPCSALHIIEIANQCFINKIFTNIIFFNPEYVKKPNITTPKRIF
jgi:tRNA threonylcarbamoyladenosine biosynthesis protein TsaB